MLHCSMCTSCYFSCDEMLIVSARIVAVSAVSHVVIDFCYYYFSGTYEVSTNTIALPTLAHQRRRKGSECSIALLPFSQGCSLGWRVDISSTGPTGSPKTRPKLQRFGVQEEMPFGVSWRKRNLHRMSCAGNSIIECWSRRMFKLLEGRETNNT